MSITLKFSSFRGSFKVQEEQTNDGFWAQYPSQVRRQVYEFSKKLPEVLEFELLPCQGFLMDLFHGDRPAENDIGLYFFPRESERLVFANIFPCRIL